MPSNGEQPFLTNSVLSVKLILLPVEAMPVSAPVSDTVYGRVSDGWLWRSVSDVIPCGKGSPLWPLPRRIVYRASIILL